MKFIEIVTLFGFFLAASGQASVTVLRSGCALPVPVVPHDGPGCGIPSFVNATEFGDNANSVGILRVIPQQRGLTMDLQVMNLSRPDLVITAWVLWVDENNPDNPDVFQVADVASPLTSYRAAFSSGMGRDPNRLTYVSATEARLRVRLNFNPTYSNEGALARRTSCLQSDVPGIQDTELRQPMVPGREQRIGVSSDFLRRYDQNTGFERLDRNGRPLVVRSPVSALAVTLIAHTDRMTHGISPGDLVVDHFEVMSFFFRGEIGNPTRQYAQTQA